MRIRLMSGLVMLALASLLTGCGPQRQAVADLLAPPDAASMAQRIEQATLNDQLAAATEMGEAYLQKHPDQEGLVHRALVGAYLASGNAQQAARHMELAVAAGATAAPKAAPAPVDTSLPSSPAAPTAVLPPAQVPASIEQSPQGLTVKAGDAAVSLGK